MATKPAAAASGKGKPAAKIRKKEKKNVAVGQAHIKSTLTTQSSQSLIPLALSSRGHHLAKLDIRVRVNRRHSPHNLPLKQQLVAHKSMVFAK